MYIYIYIYIYMHNVVHTCYKYIYIYIYTHIIHITYYVYIYTHIVCLHMYIYIYIYISQLPSAPPLHGGSWGAPVLLFMFIYVYRERYTCMCVYIYIYIYVLNSRRWNCWLCQRRTTAKTFAEDVFIDQERNLLDRRRSDTVPVSSIKHADRGRTATHILRTS